jgi:pimeloyl-ACP methyl ester carboxylesterase
VPRLDVAADLLLAELGDGPVLLVGHAPSCQVVVAAAQRDSRVIGVVLLGPTTDPRLRRLPVLAWRWLRTAFHEPLWQAPLILAPDRIDTRLSDVHVPVTVVTVQTHPVEVANGLVASAALS